MVFVTYILHILCMEENIYNKNTQNNYFKQWWTTSSRISITMVKDIFPAPAELIIGTMLVYRYIYWILPFTCISKSFQSPSS